MGSGRLLTVRIHTTRDLKVDASAVALFLEGDVTRPLARTKAAVSGVWDECFEIDATKHIATHLTNGKPVPRHLVFRLFDQAEAVVGDASLPLKVLLRKGAADGFLPIGSTGGSLRVAARLKRVKAASMLTAVGNQKLSGNPLSTPGSTNGSSGALAGASVATFATGALAAYLVRKRAKRRAKRSGASKPVSDGSITPVNLANIQPTPGLACGVASGLKSNGTGPTSTAALKRAKANDAKATGNRTPSSIATPGGGVKPNNATKSGVVKPGRRPAGGKGGGGGKVLAAAAAAAATAGAIGLGAKLISDNAMKTHGMQPGFGYTWSDDSSSDGETLRPWWNMDDASSASDSWTCDRGWSSDGSSDTFAQATPNTSQLSFETNENPSMDVDVNVITNEGPEPAVRSLGTIHADVPPVDDMGVPPSNEDQGIPPENGHEAGGSTSNIGVGVDALNMSDVEAAWADIGGGAGDTPGDPHAEMDVLDGPGIEDALAGLDDDETQPIDDAAVELALANLEAEADEPIQNDGENIEMESEELDNLEAEHDVVQQDVLQHDEEDDDDEQIVVEEYDEDPDGIPDAPEAAVPEAAVPEGEAPADDDLVQAGEELDLDSDDDDALADVGIVEGEDQAIPEEQQQQDQQQQVQEEGIWEDDEDDDEYEMDEDDDEDDEGAEDNGAIDEDDDDDEDEVMGEGGGDEDDDEDEDQVIEEDYEEEEEEEDGGENMEGE